MRGVVHQRLDGAASEVALQSIRRRAVVREVRASVDVLVSTLCAQYCISNSTSIRIVAIT